MTAKELRRQHSVDKQRIRRRAVAKIHILSARRMPMFVDEEQQEEEESNPGALLPSVGATIAAFLQARRLNFRK